MTSSSSSSSANNRHRRQLDTSLERQARLAAANAVASCFHSSSCRQRSTSLNTSFDQTHWVLVMPTLEVMYFFISYSSSFHLCKYAHTHTQGYIFNPAF